MYPWKKNKMVYEGGDKALRKKISLKLKSQNEKKIKLIKFLIK